MSTASTSDYDSLLKTVSSWPAEQRISFAHDVLGTLRGTPDVEPSAPGRNTLARALGLARGTGPVPDDAEAERILEEARMEKYGR
jgi:hypothetical protein